MKPVRRSYLIVVAVALMAGAVLAWTNATGQSSAGPTPVKFSTVSDEMLVGTGLNFSTPESGKPSAAAADAATSAASKAYGGRAVLESRYAHCVDTQSVPVLSQDCWAVSLDPSGLSSNGPEDVKAKYFLVLIDPETGKVIEGADGG